MKTSRLTLAQLPLVALLGLAAACSDGEGGTDTGSSTQGVSQSTLDKRQFLFQSAKGFTPVLDTRVFLSFRGKELSVSAGCNSIGGPYQISAGQLRTDGLGATEIGCEPALHDQDEWLTSFIEAAPGISLEGNLLTLTGADATLVLLDRKVADPDRPLVGTSWSVDSFIENDGVGNFPLSAEPKLLFAADGSLQVDTTCNSGTGSYQVAGTKLTLSNIAYTDKACSGASAAADQHIQTVLVNGTVGFTIEATRLTIERGDRGVSAQAE